jgi:hypothetical protein
MQALIKELAELVSGRSSAEQFRDVCREYAAANPGQLKDVADWFKKAIAGGRVSAASWDLVADLFAASQQVSPSTVVGTKTANREQPEFTEVGQAAPNQSALQAGDVVGFGSRALQIVPLGSQLLDLVTIIQPHVG